ncbi:MAG: hypothetical protein WCA79_14690 [Anaerolineales bacterium]
MKKIFVIAILMMVILSACGTSAPTAAPAPTTAPVVAQATTAPTITALPTEVPAATPTSAPTMAASPTEVPAVTATLAPTSAPTGSVAITAPQEWDGYYRQAKSGHSLDIQLFIKKITGTTFTGTMWWRYYAQTSTETKVQGDIITDVASATEQNRWAFNPDFNTDKSGTWLRWTETDYLVGTGYQGLNGWYYAHIRSDGQLLGIYFGNATDPNPASDLYFLTMPGTSVAAPTP